MKTCTKCKVLKENQAFSRHKGMKDLLQPRCKVCLGIEKKLVYLANKEKIRAEAKVKYQDNRENILLQKKDYALRNKEVLKIKKREYYVEKKEAILEKRRDFYLENKDKLKIYKKDYRSKNKGKCNALGAKKYARKVQATPKWLTKEHLNEIDRIYIKAKEMEKETGIKYHIDHIVPLRGKTVCGLHVPWNLQILTAEENSRKSNKL